MRTLKKALSLVLVLAMVFALAVPGFAADTTKKAADFKDYSKVTNKEAVDVLTAIGVINGNADGTFNPEGSFTRAEAATMITYLTLGKTVANALPVSATKFSDVPATHWAAKYVQYCADQGIVAGVGNGKFDPDAKLTATQWALMLLGALGYNAKNEGIGGEGWEIATTRLAMKAGVASASELTGTFNRDMAAKFALNTLKADVVEYSSNGTNITIGNTTINTGASKATVVTTKDATIGGNMGDAAVSGVYTVQFAEQHFSKLKLADSASTTDAFDRPGAKWTNGTTVIGTYGKTADATYTTTVKTSTVYADLGLAAKVAGSAVTVYVDGKVDASLSKDVEKTGTNTFGGKGVLTEVYKNVDNTGVVTLTVVEVKTYFGQVASVTKATATTDRTITIDGLKFKTEGFAKDDYVLYTKASNADDSAYEIQTVEAATVAATGKVTAVNNTKATFVVDGKTYEYSATNTETATMGKTATLYLDKYGYVIKDTGAETVTNYAIVVKHGTTGGLDSSDVARLVLADGTVVEGKYTMKTGTIADNAIFTYELNNNVYELKATTADDTITGVTTNKAQLTSTGTVYANSKTVFVVRSGDATNGYTYKSYTGIAAAPSLTGVTSVAVLDGNMAKIVYITAGTDAGTTATKAVFVTATGAQKQSAYAEDGKTVLNFVVQNAIVDGAVTTIKVKGSDVKETGLYASITTDSNGLATLGSAVASTTAKSISDKAVYSENGVLYVGTDLLGFTSDAVCYTVDNTTGAISDGTITGLTEQDTKYDGFYTVNTSGIVTGVYIYVHTA